MTTHTMTLDQCIEAWLREKKHSTRPTYSSTLQHFRGALQGSEADLDAPAHIIIENARVWVTTVKNRERNPNGPAPSYLQQRLSILTSFYDYAIQHGGVPLQENPIDFV